MNVYTDDRKPYTLSHTPRQIAEERGWSFARSICQEYCSRFHYDFSQYDPKDYYDQIPFFETEDEKLAFISWCAFEYAGENGLEPK
jgi:hypothetical protein